MHAPKPAKVCFGGAKPTVVGQEDRAAKWRHERWGFGGHKSLGSFPSVSIIESNLVVVPNVDLPALKCPAVGLTKSNSV